LQKTLLPIKTGKIVFWAIINDARSLKQFKKENPNICITVEELCSRGRTGKECDIVRRKTL
jgi:hypothetical protein